MFPLPVKKNHPTKLDAAAINFPGHLLCSMSKGISGTNQRCQPLSRLQFPGKRYLYLSTF